MMSNVTRQPVHNSTKQKRAQCILKFFKRTGSGSFLP